MAKFAKPKAIVLDIEGTTADRKFVKTTLFPFFKSNLNKFLVETFDTPETKEAVARLQEAQKAKKFAGPAIAAGDKNAVSKSVTDLVVFLLDKKIRNSELKHLELLCWFWGNQKNLIKGQVYDDVSFALHDWKTKSGIKIYTFSSGLSAAQQLMLSKTNHGNVHCMIDQFFDSSIGDKTDSQSYGSIASKIGVDGKEILFITDNDKEVNAAVGAGYKAAFIKRPGGKPASNVPKDVPSITSFAQIKF